MPYHIIPCHFEARTVRSAFVFPLLPLPMGLQTYFAPAHRWSCAPPIKQS